MLTTIILSIFLALSILLNIYQSGRALNNEFRHKQIALHVMSPAAFYSMSLYEREQFLKKDGIIVDPETIIRRTRKAKTEPETTQILGIL